MKTIACIATINGRQKQIQNTIKALSPQVDELLIVFRYEPNFPLPENCTYIVRNNTYGDADKFYWYSLAKELGDVWFFCDDDIFYPPDYVEYSLEHLKKHPNAILSYHGRTIHLRPIRSYYRHSRIESFRCTGSLGEYRRIDPNGTLGTGVMFFKSGVIELNIEDFLHPNMADIWLTKFAVESRKKMIACPHGSGWIKGQPAQAVGIFELYQFDDEVQTEVYNSIKIP